MTVCANVLSPGTSEEEEGIHERVASSYSTRFLSLASTASHVYQTPCSLSPHTPPTIQVIVSSGNTSRAMGSLIRPAHGLSNPSYPEASQGILRSGAGGFLRPLACGQQSTVLASYHFSSSYSRLWRHVRLSDRPRLTSLNLTTNHWREVRATVGNSARIA